MLPRTILAFVIESFSRGFAPRSQAKAAGAHRPGSSLEAQGPLAYNERTLLRFT
jgi:hypothetical protein